MTEPGANPQENPKRGEVPPLKIVQDELAHARDAKGSLETRAANIIISSGTLVTLLFGLVGITTGREGYVLGRWPTVFIALALAAFVVATGLAIAVSVPQDYHQVSCRALLELNKIKGNVNAGRNNQANQRRDGTDFFDQFKDEPEKWVAAHLIVALGSAREKNETKAHCLIGGTIAEAAAILLLAVAVWIILKSG